MPDTDTKIDEILIQLVTNVGENQFALDNESVTYTQARLKDDGFIAEAHAALTALIREARYDERTLCFDNVGGESIEVRAWVTKRKAALEPGDGSELKDDVTLRHLEEPAPRQEGGKEQL